MVFDYAFDLFTKNYTFATNDILEGMSDTFANTIAGFLIIIGICLLVYYSGIFSGLQFSKTPGSITEDTALQLAEAHLAKNPTQYDLVLRKNSITEYNFGWVVFYTTAAHANEKQPAYSAPGSGVIFVTRKGDIDDLGPQKNLTETIKVYEKSWKP